VNSMASRLRWAAKRRFIVHSKKPEILQSPVYTSSAEKRS
jgi:hypothetical protein